jgi:hypothetical protein
MRDLTQEAQIAGMVLGWRQFWPTRRDQPHIPSFDTITARAPDGAPEPIFAERAGRKSLPITKRVWRGPRDVPHDYRGAWGTDLDRA